MRERDGLRPVEDEAVDQLLTDVPPMTEESFQANMVRLVAAIGRADSTDAEEQTVADTGSIGSVAMIHRRRYKRRSWLVAAAAVGVLVMGGLIVPTMHLGTGSAINTAQAATLLTKAAEVSIATKTDPVVGPGQYLYVEVRAWWQEGQAYGNGQASDVAYLAENLLSHWIPADQSQEWLYRRKHTGNLKMIKGSEQEAREQNQRLAKNIDGEFRSASGRFFDTPGTVPQPDVQRPTPQWLASLPTDPKQLYDLLVKQSGSDAALIEDVNYGLSTGLYPAEIRANLYKALRNIAGLQIVDQAANLDGRTGVALGINDGDLNMQIIIDPNTGQYIGGRDVLIRDHAGMPAGSIQAYSSVITKVVTTLGQTS